MISKEVATRFDAGADPDKITDLPPPETMQRSTDATERAVEVDMSKGFNWPALKEDLRFALSESPLYGYKGQLLATENLYPLIERLESGERSKNLYRQIRYNLQVISEKLFNSRERKNNDQQKRSQ
ncbi:MAG: hypothetical protein LBS36_13665 [Oscillospiraceae bacterium]|nr:hypothetical protein [Oscillospiraceae bacterium]